MTPLATRFLRRALLGAGLALGIAAPAFAGPAALSSAPSVPSPAALATQPLVMQGGDGTAKVEQVRDGRQWRRHHRRHWRRHHRHHWNDGLSLSFNFGVPAYRYYDPVPAYRYAPRRAYRLGDAHVSWCYERYRSYRAWDNTFQPYHGPRRQCYSPYS